MKENTLWMVVGGFLVLMLGASLCMPGGGGCGAGGPGRGDPDIGRGGLKLPPRGPPGGPEDIGPGVPRGPRGGIGPGPGADRVGGPAGVPEGIPRVPGIPEYEIFPVPGESIPLGCAPVTVTPREEKRAPGRERGTGEKETSGRGPIGVGGAKGTYGARISGNPSAEQMQITQTALAKIEEKYPGIASGRTIYIFQDQNELIQALRRDGDRRAGEKGGPNAATSPDGRRVFIGPKAFERGADVAIYIVAHEFGHVNDFRQGRRGSEVQAELSADKFATDLLGYSFPSGVTKAAMAGGGTGEGGRRGGRGRGGRGMMGGAVMENPELEAIT